MLTIKSLLEDSIVHFPRWMDIRKRQKTSVGGKLLETMASNVNNIQDEINEYIDQHFIPYYEDKCSQIIDYVYRANIGYVDINNSNIVIEGYNKITDDIEYFYNNNVAYYQNGFLFIKENKRIIKYTINNKTRESLLEKTNVWNIYDEFAAFINIKRYEDEINKELYERIIYTAKNIINSSDLGIKNAIKSSMINIIPELTLNDITIEKPCAENLSNKYDEFSTILDKLENVNKDCIKDKNWDVDKWNNSFKELEYIPFTWDIPISNYYDGIGDNDDIKTDITDVYNDTDVDLLFYDKSEKEINQYINDNNVNDNLILNLTKYNEVLSPYVANYQIKATEEAIIIDEDNNKDVFFNVYEEKEINENINIEDIIDEDVVFYNIEKINAGKLENGKYYRVKFSPKDEYTPINIYKCEIQDENGNIINNDESNLMIEQEGFILNNNILMDDKTKKFVSNINDLKEYANIKNHGDGITIDKISDSAMIKIDAKNCSNSNMKIDYNCEMTDVEQENIILQNFIYNNYENRYIMINSDQEDEEKSLIIKMKANKIKFKTSKNNCKINVYIDGKYISNIKKTISENSYIYETNKYDSEQEINIKIMPFNDDKLEVFDILYNNYNLEVKYKDINNNIVPIKCENENAGIYKIPECNIEELIISTKTNIQYSPIIYKIFVGDPIKTSYITNLIQGENGKYLKIDSNCNVTLLYDNEKFSAIDNYANKIINYNTNSIYKSNNDEAYILLNLSDFSKINKITAPSGTYVFENNIHKIKLKNGESISTLFISGTTNKLFTTDTLCSIIERKIKKLGYEELEKIYCDKIRKKFAVAVYNEGSSYIDININMSDLGIIDETNIYTIEALSSSNKNIPVFEYDGKEKNSNIFKGVFDNFYIYPKGSDIYIANNETILYENEKSNIEIINTFNNNYNKNKLMYYEIENNDAFKIMFDNTLENWTIGYNNFSIILNNENIEDRLNVTKKTINKKIDLSSIIELNRIYDYNNEKIDIYEYTIDNNDNYEIVYKDNDEEFSEKIKVNSSGFNKLKYSNINNITFISYEESGDFDEYKVQLKNNYYNIDKKNGVIIWKNMNIDNDSYIYINYTIKKPIAIKFNIDYLYKKINYIVSAYKFINKYTLNNISNNQKIDLTNPMLEDEVLSENIINDYKKSDLICMECKRAGFKANKKDNYIFVNKIAKDNSLTVKSGYYYQYGKEYYMFSTNQNREIIEDNSISMNEVIKRDAKLILNKMTTNYIKNSKFVNGVINNTFNVNNFKDIKNFDGISKLNKITSCDSYNYWNTFAMEMSLIDAYNGLGIYFKPSNNINIGYAYLNITNYISNNANISFYASEGLTVYIGKEKKIKDLSLTDTFSVEGLKEVTNKTDKGIRYVTFTKEEDCSYYLIIMGQGIFDDLIINDYMNLDFHNKYLDLLNLNIQENKALNSISRIMFDMNKGNKNNNTEIDRNGYIVQASNIDWNVTKIKKYSTHDDFINECSLKNVNLLKINDKDCIVTGGNGGGNITTKPLYIGNIETIKSIIYKINDMPINAMEGISVNMLQGKAINGTFINCATKLNNKAQLNYVNDLTYQYIKLSIDIEKNKVINNVDIYIEYKSDDKNSPNEIITQGGYFISKVYDSYNEATYKLKNIDIEDLTNDVIIYIRGSREKSGLSVWTDWKEISIKDKMITNEILFEKYRFFQIKVQLPSLDSKVKINYFDLEVIN